MTTSAVKDLLHFRGTEEWEIRVTHELLAWIDSLDEGSRAQVVDAIDRLEDLYEEYLKERQIEEELR